ncbi:MAG: SusC/RagA family TonB-linked outer membrane protein, partial [Bacteroidales bacterium]|nr:SusC/RagA family TonB-linked outer membrane protein [Bacteroidales bacterium]
TTLTFSFIGYKPQDVTISGRTVIDVLLESDALALQEIIVTGIGAATDRRKVAISVETVSERELGRVPSKSLDGALVGRIAGAQISSTSGQPGQQANIILRGINTLSSTQPMVLVDGVEINTANNNVGTQVAVTGNVSSRLTDLDLSNIERVEVVQGAAAATIYGAQGANGVIQIFTKKGRKGQKTDIRISSSVSFDNALRGNLKFAKNHYYPTDAEGYIVDDLGVRAAPDPVTGVWNLPPEGFNATTLNNKPFVNPTYNHFDQYFVKNAMTLNNSLNITGAAERMDFAFGLSNLDQESPIHGGLNRSNLTSNIGMELFKGFTLRSNTQLVFSSNTTGGINNRNNVYSGISNALMVPQYVDITQIDAIGNPVVYFDDNKNSISPFYTYKFRDDLSEVNRVIQGLNANYKIGKFVELDYRYGIDHYRYDYTSFIKNQTATLTPGKGITPINGELFKRRIQETQQNSILSATLRLNLEDDFGLSLPLQSTTLFAYDWRRNDYQRLDIVGSGLDIAPPHTIANASTVSGDEFISSFITFGYLVNQRFDYANLAGISLGFRSDYSSEFGEGSKPFTFPRADAYIRLSELLQVDFINELKLRVAYGEAGVQPTRYSRIVTASTENLGNQVYLYLPSISRNPGLQVENTREVEFGLDYGFNLSNSVWFSKARGSLVYWMRNSYGTIYDIDVAPSSGAYGLKTNAIDLKSNGVQFALDLDIVESNPISWSFGTRFSKGITLVDRIENGLPIVIGASGSGLTTITEGQPVGALFGLKPLTSLTQTNSAGVPYIATADAGNYEVVNGMVVNKTTKQVQFTTEQEKIGDATPKFSLSIFNDITLYRNLSISAQFDWVYGAQAYNQTRQWLYRDRIHEDLDKEVTIDGQTGAFVAFWESMYKTNQANSCFVEDASYLRLRNLSLSYDFSKLINKSFIKGLTASFSGKNLLTFSKYSGIDPEAIGTDLNDPLARGTDLWSFPNMRTYSFGLNINF